MGERDFTRYARQRAEIRGVGRFAPPPDIEGAAGRIRAAGVKFEEAATRLRRLAAAASLGR
jgi:hypothetical protein